MERRKERGIGDSVVGVKRVEEVCGYVVHLEFWLSVCPLVQQKDSA